MITAILNCEMKFLIQSQTTEFTERMITYPYGD